MTMEIDALRMKVAELQEAIDKRLPNYSSILATIHKEFAQQAGLVYHLKDEEIAVIISGLQMYHKVEITDVKDKKPISSKQGRNMTADDV